MDSIELARRFIRVDETKDEVQIEVAVVRWEGSHSPFTKWEAIKHPPVWSAAAAIDAQICKILKDPNYFGHCRKCGEWMQAGFMHGDCICQPCAERHLGIVH